jgi:hypothetical protein
MNASDRLCVSLGMPRRILFRIFPADMNVKRLSDEDQVYSFDWEEGKQYWFDVVNDDSRDKNGIFSREIRMIDGFDRVDSLAVQLEADLRTIMMI